MATISAEGHAYADLAKISSATLAQTSTMSITTKTELLIHPRLGSGARKEQPETRTGSVTPLHRQTSRGLAAGLSSRCTEDRVDLFAERTPTGDGRLPVYLVR